jgi:hypothetical protein
MLRNLLAMLAVAFGAASFAAPPLTVTAESETTLLLAVAPQQVEDYLRVNPDAVLSAMGMKVLDRDKDTAKVRISNLRHSWEFSLKESEDKDKSEFKAVMTEAHKGGMVEAENKITVVADKVGSKVVIWTKATVNERGVTAKEIQRELVKGPKGSFESSPGEGQEVTILTTREGLMSFHLISQLSDLAEQYPQHRRDIKSLIVKVMNGMDDEDETGHGAKLGPKPPIPEDSTEEVSSSVLKFKARTPKLCSVKGD